MSISVEAQASTYALLLEQVGAALAGSQGSLALILLDIGEMADMRARAGFATAETIIDRVFDSLRGSMRERDTVLRFGDGSFAVLLCPVHNSGHAMLAAEKMRRVTHDCIADAGVSIKPQVHIGVALSPTHATGAEDLVHRAQLAVASARRRGPRPHIYDETCTEQVLRDWNLERQLESALASGEISMFYQPKVAIAGQRPVGAEALMRWLREGKPVATPDVFIPIAESSGLIHGTTLYAINTALRHLSEWPQLAGKTGVAVNINAAMFRQRDFVDIVQGALGTWHVDPDRLTLEITEGALVLDLERTTATLRTLRDLGVRVSIDDFGTGYSSLSYFKKIPADELKIDKSFVMRMLEDEADESIVRTIVGLARRFKLSVVAEGVEDTATLNALAAMGCDYAQGYLFSPALAQPKFLAWLASRS